MHVQEIERLLKNISIFSEVKMLGKAIEAHSPEIVCLNVDSTYEIKNSLVVVIKGKADIVKHIDNKPVYLKTVQKASVLGLATLFNDSNEYISTLISKTNVSLLVFSEDFISALILESPEFALQFTKLLCQKIRYLNRRIDFYTCSSAEEKVYEYLLRSRDDDNKISISMSRLSSILGIARVSLYRAIESLEKKGCIIKDNKKIILLK